MALSVSGLVKAYGAKPVLEGLDLSVADGEIHALLGPNGSGKSTFIRCLSGAVRPDAGAMIIGDRQYAEFTPREAMAAGTSVIYQHFSLVPTLSVADNIFLGSELRANGRIDFASQRKEAARLLEAFERPIHANTLVERLSVGDRQLVEIAKALRRKPSLLVLDEPTAALGEREAEQLGLHLKRLRDSGLAILYVTHLLGEVFAIADRVTVLRDGRIVLTDRVDRVKPDHLIEAISPEANRARTATAPPARAARHTPALTLDEVVVDGIGPVSFSVGAGTVIGIFGLLGSGRTELLEGVFGSRTIQQGQVRIGDQVLHVKDPATALRAGIVLVAGDRIRQSIFDKLPTRDNMLLPHMSRMSRWLTRRTGVEAAAFNRTARDVRLKPANPTVRAWTLSGGNQQKLAVGRWLVARDRFRVLMLDEPTQGIDVGARRDLYDLVRKLAHERGQGGSVYLLRSRGDAGPSRPGADPQARPDHRRAHPRQLHRAGAAGTGAWSACHPWTERRRLHDLRPIAGARP